MTQEDKELLLKDLCARLPYGVICYNSDTESNFTLSDVADIESGYPTFDYGYGDLETVVPYLFPLSSMTEEQSKIYHELIEGMFGTSALINFEVLEEFFYKNHIDFRGLIRLGLAKDSTGLNIY